MNNALQFRDIKGELFIRGMFYVIFEALLQAVEMSKSKYHYIRHAARILGVIACVFYLFISVKGGLAEVVQGKGDKLIPFFPYLAIAVAGYMIAYVKERKGGIIMLIGGVALIVFFMVYSGGVDWIRALVYGLPFLLCGVAFTYCNEKE